MGKENLFRNLTVGELINFLEKLPVDYEVVIYDVRMEKRDRDVMLEIFEDEKLVEVY